MSDALIPILAAKRELVAQRKKALSPAAIEDAAHAAAPSRGFARALRDTAKEDGIALIAEMKRRSPSGGLIRPGFDPATVARDYATGGAACLSVLTDAPFFDGRDSDLAEARDATTLPVLRKDFVVDSYQVAESRALGADCILLIVAALSQPALAELAAAARAFQLDVLVEVHDEEELDRALEIESPLIGINNRNLKTLKTDLNTFESLAARVPRDRLLIAESGIRGPEDLRRMARAGAVACLVGESLLRKPDLASATRELLGRGHRNETA